MSNTLVYHGLFEAATNIIMYCTEETFPQDVPGHLEDKFVVAATDS